MNYTLTDLQTRIAALINEQGPDAPASWWIYTAEDVVVWNEEGDEVPQSPEICNSVLCNLQDYDSIYQSIGDAISTEIEWLESDKKAEAANPS